MPCSWMIGPRAGFSTNAVALRLRSSARRAGPAIGRSAARPGRGNPGRRGTRAPARREDAVGQHALGVARRRAGCTRRAGPTGRAREDVDLHAERLRQPGGLAADAAVAPEPDDRPRISPGTAGPVPDAVLLVADHAAQVAGQVDHHGQVPLGDGGVEDAAGVAGADAERGQPQAVELLVSRPRRSGSVPTRPHVPEIRRRARAEEDLLVAQDVGGDDARAPPRARSPGRGSRAGPPAVAGMPRGRASRSR